MMEDHLFNKLEGMKLIVSECFSTNVTVILCWAEILVNLILKVSHRLTLALALAVLVSPARGSDPQQHDAAANVAPPHGVDSSRASAANIQDLTRSTSKDL